MLLLMILLLLLLTDACDRLTPSGRQVLKRICEGERPCGPRAWPDEG